MRCHLIGIMWSFLCFDLCLEVGPLWSEDHHPITNKTQKKVPIQPTSILWYNI